MRLKDQAPVDKINGQVLRWAAVTWPDIGFQFSGSCSGHQGDMPYSYCLFISLPVENFVYEH